MLFSNVTIKNPPTCTFVYLTIISFTHLFHELFNYMPIMCQALLEILKEERVNQVPHEIYILLREQETEKLILSGSNRL